MPKYLGGDINEIVCKHALGTFRFQAKSNESFTVDPGGLRANDDANSITASGEAIDQINRVRPSIEGPVAADFDSENETKNFPLLAGHPEQGVWTVAHNSGVTWKLRGRPVGDIQFDTNTAQFNLKVSGSGIAEKV